MNILVENKTVKTLFQLIAGTKPAVVSRQDRIANIDRLRIIASFGIVWFHTENAVGRSFGYSGLPIFLMVFCALILRKGKPDNLRIFFSKKACRLLKPWLFWSVIYLIAKLMKQLLFSGGLSHNFAYYMFLTGPSIHLWYLPYAFVAAQVLNLLQRWTMKIPDMVVALFATVLGAVMLFTCSVLMSSVQIPSPIPQYMFGLPAVSLGFAIGRVYSIPDNRMQRLSYLGIAIITCISSLLLVYLDYEFLIVPYSIAIVLVCAAFIWNGKFDPISDKCASLSYGIYLVHPLVASILSLFLIGGTEFWLRMIIVFLVSLAVTAVLKKTFLRQFV